MFVGSVRAWVRGFHRLSLWVRHLECWFVSSLLERWFNVLIFCFQCFADCGYRGFFFFQREKRKKKRLRCFVDCGCRGFFFFLRGRRGRRRLRFSWGSFVEIECLILEFHVNFNRNRVCDTRFATMNSSPSASRC